MSIVPEQPKLKRFMECETKIIQFADIDHEDFQITEPTIYEIHRDGVKFEFLLSRKPDSNQAVAFGTGNVGSSITKYQLPIFSRGRWADRLFCNGIWYFDPSVYLGEATLCWYYGTNDRWYLREIANIIQIILKKWDISIENTVFSGSSGGGFSSMMLATMLHGKAAAINPQFFPEKFHTHLVRLFKQSVLKPDETLIGERVSVTDLICAENYFPQIYVKQNLQSPFDLEEQMTPFLHEVSRLRFDCQNRVHFDFYNAEGGHNAMPTEEETMNWIRDILERPLLELPVVKTTGYRTYHGQLFFYLDTGNKIRSHENEPVDFTPLHGYRFKYQLLSKKDMIGDTEWSENPFCSFPLPPDGVYEIKYYIDDGTQHKIYLAKTLTITNASAPNPVTDNEFAFLRCMEEKLNAAETKKKALHESIRIAQTNSFFTFTLQETNPADQYSWAVYDGNRQIRFESVLSNDPVFTYCAQPGKTVQINMMITDGETKKKSTYTLGKIKHEQGTYIWSDSPHICRAGEAAEAATPLKLRFRADEVNYCTDGSRFTFTNERFEPDAEYAFVLLDGENKVLERTTYSPERSATFSLEKYTGTVKLKAMAKHDGLSSSRIAAEVFCDPERDLYRIDPSYKNPMRSNNK